MKKITEKGPREVKKITGTYRIQKKYLPIFVRDFFIGPIQYYFKIYGHFYVFLWDLEWAPQKNVVVWCGVVYVASL